MQLPLGTVVALREAGNQKASICPGPQEQQSQTTLIVLKAIPISTQSSRGLLRRDEGLRLTADEPSAVCTGSYRSGMPYLQVNIPRKIFVKLVRIILQYFIGTYIYNIFFHPLNKYPGPTIASASRIPLTYTFLSRRAPH